MGLVALRRPSWGPSLGSRGALRFVISGSTAQQPISAVSEGGSWKENAFSEGGGTFRCPRAF
eukprot:8464615-Pyramimonas_sp.AAC.1